MSVPEHAIDARLQEQLKELRSSGQDALADRLASFFAEVASEAAQRKAFGRALEQALTTTGLDSEGRPARTKPASARPHRRRPALVNPFELYERGEDELRKGLASLDVEELKDVIAEHGMDRDKLAMKWKTPDRLIERIIETVRTRTQKGDVFRQ